LSLALAFIFVVYDGTKSIADQRWYVTTVAEVWATFHESSLTQIKPTLEALAPWLWDAANYVLNASFCLVLVILGTILVLIGRKRRPLIGYARN
jgi:hypothetical protein